MDIYVLMKQTFDTEEKIVLQNGAVSQDGVKWIINPYDEYAVEEAIRIKEQHGGKVTVVSVGPERAAEALRTALAMGADEAVLLSDDRIADDEHSVSKVIAAFLAKEHADLLLGGNFSTDHGAGQVAIRVARLLSLPHIGSVTKVTIADGKAVVLRDAEGDTETVEVVLPALLTAQQGLNEPRYPSLPGIMKAKKKPLRRLSLGDLGLTEDDTAPKTVRESLSLPPERKAGQLLQGDPGQQAKQLVHLLRHEAKAL